MSNFVSSISPFSANNGGRWRLFWTGLLVLSLMLNLLIAGLMIGHFWQLGPQGRAGGPAYGQFAPGRFFADLARDRRHELGSALRASKQDIQKLRGQSDDNAQKLATELGQENYDPTKVNALIDGFTTGPESVAAGGGKVLKDFYAKLTPDERKQLAKDIREAPMHGEGGWQRRWKN